MAFVWMPCAENRWDFDGLGALATVAVLAEREGIASSYMTRVLRLTLLAPGIVEAILDEALGPEIALARLLDPFPVNGLCIDNGSKQSLNSSTTRRFDARATCKLNVSIPAR